MTLQMPRKNLLKDPLPITNNSIPMTRNNILKTPAINSPHTIIKPHPIPPTKPIPQHSLLPRRLPLRILNMPKQLRGPSRISILPRLTVLFRSRQIKHQICFNQCSIWFIIKHQFLIRMSIHKFIFEIVVEFFGDFCLGFVFCGEDGLEVYVSHFFVRLGLLGAFFGEAFGSDEMCIGICGVPVGEEDMMLEIRGCYVCNSISEGLELG